MSFLGEKSLRLLLESEQVITPPFDPENIKNGAYELRLGDQVFQTGKKPRSIKHLENGQEIYIEPGQFALLLTEETVRMPKDKIGFISIKAGIKFQGLVNVSGFHVDPSFDGKLLFSVYNAGPSVIVLSRGEKYFPLWFADLSEDQKYSGSHAKQTRIPDDPVRALSQGELTSPNVLSKRIQKLKWGMWLVHGLLSIIASISVALAILFLSQKNELKSAIDFGYQKRDKEKLLDSTIKSYQLQLKMMESRMNDLEQARKTVHP